jgi:hypothetical protein
MVSANGQAVFAVVAKDAASKVLKGVGKSFGSMRANAVNAFKAIGAAAVTAVTAVAGFTLAAIKSAAEDEKATIRLNAALKARGFSLDSLGPKVEEQIKAMQRLGITDDEVRDGLEVGSRFFKNQNKLLEANAVAANISAATGKPLAAVMLALGKGTQGSTRGLAALGIEVEKGATLQDILTAANQKYQGVAEEIANSTAGKFAAAQIDLNEQFEAFGAKFLPAVNEALGFLTNTILPMVTPALDTLGDIIFGVADAFAGKGGVAESIGKVVGPILEDLQPAFEDVVKSVGNLFGSVSDLIGALWGDGEGALAFAFKMLGEAIKIAFTLAKPFFDALAWLLDNITAIVDALSQAGGAEAQAQTRAGQTAAANSNVFGMGENTGGGNSMSFTNYTVLDGSVIATSSNAYLGGYVTNNNGTRNTGRYP